MNERYGAILQTFAEKYGSADGVRFARAPGRVNLIGEHTDYNEGFVLPMAIDRDMVAAFRPNDTNMVNLHTIDLESSASYSLVDPKVSAEQPWMGYAVGMSRVLMDHDHKLAGIDVVLQSTVPVGSGLSSSAAYLVAMALAHCDTAGLAFERFELAKLCREAEVRYVGVNVGIMDQFTSLHGEAGSCLFLDCRSLQHQAIPLVTDVVKVIVCDTTVRHQLGASEYNKRRAECEEGVKLIKEHLPHVTSLRDVAPEDVADLQGIFPPVVLKRVRHVVTENQRVEVAVQALMRHNFVQFGVCMEASHDSLRDDYEVSCRELDVMVEIASGLKGTYGARMTGGGFGGCTVNLVPAEHSESFCKAIASGYEERTGLKPGVYVCSSAPGAQVMGVDEI